MNRSLVQDRTSHRYTLQEAQTFTLGERFHDVWGAGCKLEQGSRGALHLTLGRTYRVSGKLQTWKRTPGKYRLPIKHGMFGPSGEITSATLGVHRERECVVWATYLHLLHEKRELQLIAMLDAGLPLPEGVSL